MLAIGIVAAGGVVAFVPLARTLHALGDAMSPPPAATSTPRIRRYGPASLRQPDSGP